MMRFLICLANILSCFIPLNCFASDVDPGDILFESGTLGETGVPWSELENGTVPGTNINDFVFNGVRFELTKPVITSQVGGHFVVNTFGTFFGAIVALDDANDFPDSADLSTSDVLGAAELTFPDPSAEVFGTLEARLDPGWYALIFGSGLFGAQGGGGAVRNGMDIGDPSYIGFQFGFGWGERASQDGNRYFVSGKVIPEPATLVLFTMASGLVMCLRSRK